MKMKETSETRGENMVTPAIAQDVVTEAKRAGQRYSDLTKCIRETIQEVVPSKKRTFRNGRAVSERTQKIFDERKVANDQKKPTLADRKKWNRAIARSCRNDYRDWVSRWTERIEEANKMGDTKEIYRGVKAVCGTKSTFSDTQPTKLANGKLIQQPQELADTWSNFLAKKFEQTEQETLRAEFEALHRKSHARRVRPGSKKNEKPQSDRKRRCVSRGVAKFKCGKGEAVPIPAASLEQRKCPS